MQKCLLKTHKTSTFIKRFSIIYLVNFRNVVKGKWFITNMCPNTKHMMLISIADNLQYFMSSSTVGSVALRQAVTTNSCRQSYDLYHGMHFSTFSVFVSIPVSH